MSRFKIEQRANGDYVVFQKLNDIENSVRIGIPFKSFKEASAYCDGILREEKERQLARQVVGTWWYP